MDAILFCVSCYRYHSVSLKIFNFAISRFKCNSNWTTSSEHVDYVCFLDKMLTLKLLKQTIISADLID